MLASAARSGAVLVVLAWLAYANPERGLAYAWVLGTASLFLVTGLAQLRFAGFLYFFVLLMQMAFSFRPRLLVWSTLCGIGAWTLGFLTILYGADIVTDPPGADIRMRLATPHSLRGRDAPIDLWTG